MLIQSNPHINPNHKFHSDWSQEDVKNEPMLFNCSVQAAIDLGGPITKEFLKPFAWASNLGVVDSRVHMLMPGWYPAIPGYHHDDVPRSGRNGQPNYISPEYYSSHVMGLVNGDICPTQFAVGAIELEIPEEGVIYKQWHPKVDAAVKSGKMRSVLAPSGVYIGFDDRVFHQATAAVAPGWRWFIRVSFDTDRINNVTNEIRKQVQVYLEHPMEGW